MTSVSPIFAIIFAYLLSFNVSYAFSKSIFSKSIDLNFLLSSNCLILASSSEPWGLVVNEALYHGCPAIVSDKCGCVDELINDSVNGYKFNMGDTTNLSMEMMKAISNFINTEKLTNDCKSSISIYTPYNAAKEIYLAINSVGGKL